MNRALIIIAIAACTPSVPEQPSFQLDVLPLLAANCQRCHGTPPLYDVPEEFRLDTFDPIVLKKAELLPMDPECMQAVPDPRCADDLLFGAADYAPDIVFRTSLDDGQMPPRFPLDGWQIETFERWVTNGAARGEPRPGNLAPLATVESTRRTESSITVRVRIDDTDGDSVGGELRIASATEDYHFGNVRSGVLEVTRKTAEITAGDYSLTAHLDDGAELHVISLGMLTIGGP